MIQQILESAYDGDFVQGEFHHDEIALKLQRRIYRDFIRVVFSQENPQSAPRQPLLAENSPVRPAETARFSRLGEHIESRALAPAVGVAGQASGIPQGPGSLENTHQHSTSSPIPTQAQALDHLVSVHRSGSEAP